MNRKNISSLALITMFITACSDNKTSIELAASQQITPAAVHQEFVRVASKATALDQLYPYFSVRRRNEIESIGGLKSDDELGKGKRNIELAEFKDFYEGRKFTVTETSLKEDIAVLKVAIGDFRGANSMSGSVRLVREEGAWKIDVEYYQFKEITLETIAGRQNLREQLMRELLAQTKNTTDAFILSTDGRQSVLHKAGHDVNAIMPGSAQIEAYLYAYDNAKSLTYIEMMQGEGKQPIDAIQLWLLKDFTSKVDEFPLTVYDREFVFRFDGTYPSGGFIEVQQYEPVAKRLLGTFEFYFVRDGVWRLIGAFSVTLQPYQAGRNDRVKEILPFLPKLVAPALNH